MISYAPILLFGQQCSLALVDHLACLCFSGRSDPDDCRPGTAADEATF